MGIGWPITRVRQQIASGTVEQIHPYGQSALARLFSIVYLGDFVSVYLAFLYATDPTPMPMIDYIKANL